MRFETGWRGIIIVAESDEDEDVLRQLAERLPNEAATAYEDGIMRTERDGDSHELRMVFER